jgi:Protein of unknown function (DUF2569)
MAVSDQNEQHRGVRGWLLILCLNVAILDPLTMLFTIFLVTSATKPYFGEHPELLRLCLASGLCRLALAVFSVYAGIALWKIVPGAVSVAKKYFLAVLLYSFVASLLPVLVGVPRESYQEFAGETVFNGFLTMAYAITWYIYLQRSRRVKATYPSA